MPRLTWVAGLSVATVLAACAGTTQSPVAAPTGPAATAPAIAAAQTMAAALPATGPTGITSTAPSLGPCGGVAIAKPGGGVWQCSFDDEFTGTLNTRNWVVQQTATSGYTTGTGAGTVCYLNNPNNVSVSGGSLNLTVRKEPNAFACPYPGGSFMTQYTSGMVSSYGLFSQTYGLFEVSAKLPAATTKGLQETLWLWPSNAVKYGPWPGSGEIDFGEFYSQYPTLDVPYIHYNAARPDPNVTAYNCTIANENQFHTYGVEWTSSSITIIYDGKTCLVDKWHPAAPLVAPQPFNQPFLIALTQALGIGTNALVPGVTPLPATTQIDWVRAWK
jgi:beta-glucanase (GH16 family)